MANTDRNNTLDLFRGVALILMIEQHLGSWLWTGLQGANTFTDHPIIVLTSLLGGLAAPMFIIATGIGATYLFAKKAEHFTQTALKRSLAIFVFAYLLNVFVPSWFSWQSWYILHFLAFCLGVSPLLIQRKNRTLVILAIVTLLISAVISELLSLPDSLSNSDMSGQSTWAQRSEHPVLFLKIMFLQGQFSILPWLPAFIISILAGRAIISQKLRGLRIIGALSISMGTFLFVMGAFIQYVHLPYSIPVISKLVSTSMLFYPISPGMVLLLTGITLLLLDVFIWLSSIKHISASNIFVTAGQTSLTFLFFHIVLFRQLSIALSQFRSFSEMHTLIITFAMCTFVLIFSRIWYTFNFRYGLEWLLRKI